MRGPFSPGDAGNAHAIWIIQADLALVTVHSKGIVDVGGGHPTIRQKIAVASKHQIRTRLYPEILADQMNIIAFSCQRPSA
jgi:hypothetical protein